MVELEYRHLIRPYSIIQYQQVIWSSGGSRQSYARLENLSASSSRASGELTETSIRRLRYAVNLLEYSSLTEERWDEKIQRFHPYKLGFLTCTLPAPQGDITDDVLKRKALMPFLAALQKKHGHFNYVWKAETQANGNLHFHITLNKWIHYSKLRAQWNRQLRALGYIDEYRRQQETWHKDGFRLRPELLEFWPASNQHKAYLWGLQTDWSEPNTTDIHTVRHIENLSSYLIKYMSKKHANRRPVSGKTWGCSEKLKYTNTFSFGDRSINSYDVRDLISHCKELPKVSDFVTVYMRDQATWKMHAPYRLQEDYLEWLSATREGR